MAAYVALGAATVEADSPDEVVERVAFEECDWTVRYVCTAREWVGMQAEGKRPWLGKASWLTMPLLGWTMTTGRVGPVEVWHPIRWVTDIIGIAPIT